MRILYTIFRTAATFLIVLGSVISASAQYTITGQSPVVVGSTWTYTCVKTGGAWPSPQNWSAYGGTVLSHTISADKLTITASIQWTQSQPIDGNTVSVSAGSLTGMATVIVNCGSTAAPGFTVAAPGAIAYAPKAFTITPSGGGGTTYRWYNNASDITPVQTGGNFTTPVISTSTTYYLDSYNSASNCASSKVAVSLQIVPAPPAPTAPTFTFQSTICGSGSAKISASPTGSGTQVNWYAAATGGTVLANGTIYNTPTLTSQTTYYITSYNPINGAESSPRTPVVVNIFPAHAATTWTTKPHDPYTTIAYGHGVLNLQAYTEGSAVYWYDSPIGGTLLGTGSGFTTPELTTATTYYAASHDANGCESARLPVIADLRPLVSAVKITVNRIRTGGVTTEAGINALTNAQRTSQISHIDGLLRSSQQIVLQGSPLGKDIVKAVEYLNNGKDPKNYLTYTAPTGDGSFKPFYKSEQSAFYGPTTTTDKIANDNYPFTLTKTEDSPLSRLLEQGAPGIDKQPGASHTQRINYSYNTGATNSEAEEVLKFNTDGTTSFYAANTLNRLENTDENGNKQITFIDGAGRVIVKKKQLDDLINGTTVNYLQSYYVYDDFGRVIYIISPKGVATIRTNGGSFTQAIKDNYATQFLYDNRGRMVEKKTPGQASIYYVYDKMNRPALIQDGLLRASNSWLFVKYDFKRRPIMQGVYINTTQTSRAAMQTMVDGLYLTTNTTYPPTSWYETRAANVLHGYSNVSFPMTNDDAGKTAIQVLSVSYFESYDFDYNGTRDCKYDSTAYTGQPTWSNYLAKDLPTGNKRLVLGTSKWLYNYVFYDDRGRVIQVRTNNHLSAPVDNLMTAIYDFEGKVLSVKNYHNAGTGTPTTVINKYDYDAQGRVLKIYQNNNSAVKDQLLVAYEYNEVGQLVDKKLHGDDPVTPTSYLQSIDLRYNILGQLQSINNAQLVSDGVTNDESNDFFGMEFGYDTNIGIGNVPQYDGKISGIVWKSPGASTGTMKDEKSYLFNYDKAGKLKSAVSKVSDGTSWNKELNALNETVMYDHNGNILSLTRNQRLYQITGKAPSYGAETIDNLTYSYDLNIGDRLLKITDAATGTSPTAGFDNGGSNSNDDYTYDANGNLLTDANKGITGTNNNIVYNILGKPTTIQFSDGRRVEYVYDASGAKLTMKTYAAGGGPPTTTDYVDRFVYVNGTLGFFGCPEGRVANNANTLEYQYAITDHQGNTRILFTSANVAPQVSKATFETDESAQFTYYPVTGGLKNNQPTNNSTLGGTNSQHLNGGNNAAVGVSKSFLVYPGDQLKIEAYARYDVPAQTPSGLSGFAANLLSAFSLSPPAGGEVGTASAAINGYGGWEAGGYANGTNDQTDPKAFVTILLFDKNYNFLDVTYDQVKSSGSMVYISASYTVKEAGYAYLYISNEMPYLTDVYFDDITMTYTPTRVIQYNEYYPYGLQANTSWTRDNTKNNFKYNGASELNVTTGWYDLPYRNYDPAIGRFVQVDPLGSMQSNWSPYQYGNDNPVLFNDPQGLKSDEKGDKKKGPKVDMDQLGFSATCNCNAIDAVTGGEHPEQLLNVTVKATYLQTNEGGIKISLSNALYLMYGPNGESQSVNDCDNCPDLPEFDPYRNDHTRNYWYNTDTKEVYQVLPGASVTAAADEKAKAEFFDAAGKWDVGLNSGVGITELALSITAKQLANSKYYASGIKTTKVVAKNAKTVANAGAGAGFVLTFIEFGFSEGKRSDWAKLRVGIGIGIIAEIPDIGLPIAIILGSYEANGGFDDYYKSFDQPIFSDFKETGYEQSTFFGH